MPMPTPSWTRKEVETRMASCFFVVASSTSGAGAIGSSGSEAYPPTLAVTAGVRATGRRKAPLDTEAGEKRRAGVISWGVGWPTKPRRAAATSGSVI